jgi:hypothetical protein
MMMQHPKPETFCDHWCGMAASIVMNTGLFPTFLMRATLVVKKKKEVVQVKQNLSLSVMTLGTFAIAKGTFIWILLFHILHDFIVVVE